MDKSTLMFCVYMYHLVLMAGTLTIFSQALHSLVDESYVLLIDVESQKPQSPCGAATDTVQELKCLTHQIIVVLVILVAQKVLEMNADKMVNKYTYPSFWTHVILMYLGSVVYVYRTDCVLLLTTYKKKTVRLDVEFRVKAS